jgi:hypothetical protein
MPTETSLCNPFGVVMYLRHLLKGRCSFLAPTPGFVGNPVGVVRQNVSQR